MYKRFYTYLFIYRIDKTLFARMHTNWKYHKIFMNHFACYLCFCLSELYARTTLTTISKWSPNLKEEIIFINLWFIFTIFTMIIYMVFWENTVCKSGNKLKYNITWINKVFNNRIYCINLISCSAGRQGHSLKALNPKFYYGISVLLWWEPPFDTDCFMLIWGIPKYDLIFITLES